MAILGEFVKFSIFPLLLVILSNGSAQNFGISEFQNPLTINTSPGFLSGAIQHIGNQECTQSGTCLHIPQLCPNSSCCVSSTPNNFPGYIILPNSLSQSKCGCWDSRKKSCQPVSNFHISYSSCDSQNGVQIRSEIQISRGSREIISNLCKTNMADIQLVAGIEGSSPVLQIQTLTCTQQLKQMGRLDIAGRDLTAFLDVTLVERGYSFVTNMRAVLSAKYKTSGNSAHSASKNNGQDGNKSPLKCAVSSENLDFVAISSGFLSGAINNFLGQNTGICSGQGTCGRSMPGCHYTSCCLVSTSGDGDENSSEDSCQCLGVGEDGPNACLVHHKIYKVSSFSCTKTGERVQRSLSVRIPSNGLNRCMSHGGSWEKASINFEINDNGNIEAIIEAKKCILSGENQEYLEVEKVIKAELNLDIVSKILKEIE